MSAFVLVRIGRRGAALLFFALLDFVSCVWLLSPPRPLTETFLWPQAVLPLWVWASLWGAVSLLCFVYAFRRRDGVAFIAAAGLMAGWGLLYFLGWVDGSVQRGYFLAAIWLAFAALVYLIAGGIPAPPPRAAE